MPNSECPERVHLLAGLRWRLPHLLQERRPDFTTQVRVSGAGTCGFGLPPVMRRTMSPGSDFKDGVFKRIDSNVRELLFR